MTKALLPTISQWTYWYDAASVPDNGVVQHFCRDLCRLGYQEGSQSTANLIVREAEMELQQETEQHDRADLRSDQIIIRLIPAAFYRRQSKALDESRNVIYCELPLCRNRLLATLEKAYMTFNRLATDTKTAGPITDSHATAASLAAPISQQHPAVSPGIPEAIKTDVVHALLVDDNEMNLNILKMYCKKRKIRYVAARDGQEAFDQYKHAHEAGTPFTFCAMDLQMPNLDGGKATEAIRGYEHEHGLEKCNIIMVTAQSSEVDKARAKLCQGYFVKPLRIRTLDEWLATHFYAS